MDILVPLTRRLWPAFAPSPDWEPPRPLTDVYVVGDIHGCTAALEQLLVMIDADVLSRWASIPGTAAHPAGRLPHLVFVGDYIDRGTDSAGVLAALRRIETVWPGQAIFLRGNHEDMLLAFLDDPQGAGPRWLQHGGVQTLASFGVMRGVPVGAPRAAFMALRDALRARFPAGLEAWLRALPLAWNSGTAWVTHAGANPHRSMTAQTRRSLLWGDPRFFEVPRQDKLWVVHGHYVTDNPAVDEGRISVDTGAVYGGKLTAAALRREGKIAFFSV